MRGIFLSILFKYSFVTVSLGIGGAAASSTEGITLLVGLGILSIDFKVCFVLMVSSENADFKVGFLIP